MPQFRYETAEPGRYGIENVSESLADAFRGRPGYVEVIDDERAAELKGEELEETARALGVEHVSALKADEKRAAIVAATAPDAPVVDTEEK